MSKNKTLLSIEITDEGVFLQSHIDGDKEILALSACLNALFDERPELYTALMMFSKLTEMDEDFKKLVDDSTIQLPDFNKLLKN